MAISAEILNSYKKIDEAKADALLTAEIEKNNKKIVVLDDDPTGVQTVHDISVYTGWDHDSILSGFNEKNNLFYIMTNSRGFTAEQTTKAHHEISAMVDQVARETGREYIFISRSDSTLRGHYPLETELLKADYEKYTGKTIDGETTEDFLRCILQFPAECRLEAILALGMPDEELPARSPESLPFNKVHINKY